MLAVLLALAPQAAPTQLVVPRVSTFPIAARRTAGRDADQLLLAGGLFTPGQLTAFEVDPTSGMLQGTALLEADSFGGVLGVLDVDGDGRDDLVQQDRILFDETPFGFAAPSTVAVDLPLVPSGLRAVARSVDLDANGRDDIVLFHPDGLAPVQAIYALGHRSFSAAVPLPDVGDPRAAELFDADADGDLDLVTLTAAGAFEIRENDGGPFPWPVTWSEDLGFRGDPIVLIADDLDGDGSNDLLVGRRELRVHLGGSNGFATSAVIPGALVRSRAWLVDIDGDGDEDLLTGGSAGGSFRTQWLDRTGPASFGGAPVDLTAVDDVSGPVLADLDGDGQVKVYGLQASTGDLGVVDLPIAPSGSSPRAIPRGPSAEAVAFGDLDGDGDLDLVTSAGGEGLAVFERVARRELRLADRVVPDGFLGFGFPLVELRVGPGAPDTVAFLDAAGDVRVLDDPLGATPTPPRSIASGYSTANAFLASADLDGDGDDDIVLGRLDGSGLDWVEQTGPLVFAAPTPLVDASPGADVESFFVADFDLDSDADIVLQEDLGGPSFVRTYRRSGAGFAAGAPSPITGRVVGVSDLRPGGLDVLVSGLSFGGLELTGFQVDAAGGLIGSTLWAEDDTADVPRTFAVIPADSVGAPTQIYAQYVSFSGPSGRVELYVPGALTSTPVDIPSDGVQGLRVVDLDGNGPELILFGDEVWTQRPVIGVDRAGSATPYCFEQTRGAEGRAAQLDVASVRSATGPLFPLGRLRFDLFDLPPQRTVLLLASRSPGFAPGAGGALGSLCLGAPIGRLLGPGQVLSTSTRGTASLDLETFSLPLGGALVPASPGEQWFFQAWYRDVEGGAQSSRFTNGVSARL